MGSQHGRLTHQATDKKHNPRLAKYTQGEWHRCWLLSSGQCIKTRDTKTCGGYGHGIPGEWAPKPVKTSTRLTRHPGDDSKGRL